MKTYRLYALPKSSENIVYALNERFSRVTPSPWPGYVLIYRPGRKPKSAVEITDESLYRLTDQDRQWLSDCNISILAEALQQAQKNATGELSAKMEELEKALEKEKRVNADECGKGTE